MIVALRKPSAWGRKGQAIAFAVGVHVLVLVITVAGAYSGTYGLGTQYVLGREVRPFRRLIAAQAIFRREVFL